MAAALLDAKEEYSVTLWNRSAESPLTAQLLKTYPDATFEAAAKEALKGADIICSMLFDSAAFNKVVVDNLEQPEKATFVFCFSTVSPEDSVAAAQRLKEKGYTLVEAPVLGTDTVAQG
jgi:3-hydroxyisobutyrate dehydrogenase-like beta-hydroxyacid dehydrogenase